jgi:hypothetical protein
MFISAILKMVSGKNATGGSNARAPGERRRLHQAGGVHLQRTFNVRGRSRTFATPALQKKAPAHRGGFGDWRARQDLNPRPPGS